MKKYGVAILCAIGLGCSPKPQPVPAEPMAQKYDPQILWVVSPDFSLTKPDGKVCAVEFGFSNDGLVHWRIGKEQ